MAHNISAVSFGGCANTDPLANKHGRLLVAGHLSIQSLLDFRDAFNLTCSQRCSTSHSPFDRFSSAENFFVARSPETKFARLMN